MSDLVGYEDRKKIQEGARSDPMQQWLRSLLGGGGGSYPRKKFTDVDLHQWSEQVAKLSKAGYEWDRAEGVWRNSKAPFGMTILGQWENLDSRLKSERIAGRMNAQDVKDFKSSNKNAPTALEVEKSLLGEKYKGKRTARIEGGQVILSAPKTILGSLFGGDQELDFAARMERGK